MTKKQKSILAIMAHPDDAELICMGTLLKHKKEGSIVNVIVVTGGEKGVSIKEENNLTATTRREESINAFDDTGISLKFLNFEDGHLTLDNKLISAIEKEIDKVNPDILITHYNDKSGLDHQDHSIVSKAVLNAVIRNESIKTTLLAEPLNQKIVFDANYFVDVTEFFSQKVESLKAHKSQAGRAYLTEEFHKLKCQNNALKAGRSHFKNGKLFEAFVLHQLLEN